MDLREINRHRNIIECVLNKVFMKRNRVLKRKKFLEPILYSYKCFSLTFSFKMSYYGQNQGDPWGSTYNYGDSSYSAQSSFGGQTSYGGQSSYGAQPSFQSPSLQPVPAPAPVQQFSNSNFNHSYNQPVPSYQEEKQSKSFKNHLRN